VPTSWGKKRQTLRDEQTAVIGFPWIFLDGDELEINEDSFESGIQTLMRIGEMGMAIPWTEEVALRMLDDLSVCMRALIYVHVTPIMFK
jgi:hypothetical protein